MEERNRRGEPLAVREAKGQGPAGIMLGLTLNAHCNMYCEYSEYSYFSNDFEGAQCCTVSTEKTTDVG